MGASDFLADLDAVGVVAVEQDHPVLRDEIDEAPEAHLDLLQVAEDIGVVELDVVQDEQLGQVMQEL